MQAWQKAALDYVPQWIDYQMRLSEQPGCSVAIVEDGRLIFERAFGVADHATGRKLTPRHRFRIASHSKTFTAAAIMKLREDGRLGLDDRAGRHVDGLHPDVAAATIQQLLSHSAGLSRDGTRPDQWIDEAPFLDERALRRDLALAPTIPAATRFKYSNHGIGLLGLVIEVVTGEPYGDHVRRILLEPQGLDEIASDMPLGRAAPFAAGHGRRLPLGYRVVIPGDNETRALAPATGFVATARQLARFFASLDPAATKSPLTAASRREMIHRRWTDAHASVPIGYGLGVMRAKVGECETFGHGGAFQGGLSRTMVLEGRALAVTVLTNAVDAPAADWAAGILRILAAFESRGAPGARTRDWRGRWWSLWETVDLVPFRDRVLLAAPALADPFDHVAEIEVTGRDRGIQRLAGGFENHGEPAELVRSQDGTVREIRLGGSRYVTEARAKAGLKRRYGGSVQR